MWAVWVRQENSFGSPLGALRVPIDMHDQFWDLTPRGSRGVIFLIIGVKFRPTQNPTSWSDIFMRSSPMGTLTFLFEGFFVKWKSTFIWAMPHKWSTIEPITYNFTRHATRSEDLLQRFSFMKFYKIDNLCGKVHVKIFPASPGGRYLSQVKN